MPKFVEDWRTAWRSTFYRDQFLTSMIGFLLSLVLMRLFLGYVEGRSGIGLPDPLLSHFTSIDLKWITYSFIYSAIVLGFVSVALHPFSFLLVLRAMIVLVLLRITFLFLLPLDPPPGCIPIVDPFIRISALSPTTSRDLFFSWHTAVITLFAFSARFRDMKIIFSAAAFVVSVLFLLQHAHYTIDVVAAPCFAYVAHCVSKSNTMHNGATRP